MNLLGKALMAFRVLWLVALLPMSCSNVFVPSELLRDVSLMTWPASLGGVLRAAIFAAYALLGAGAIALGSEILRRERWR